MEYGSHFRGPGGGSLGGSYCSSKRYVKKNFIKKSLYGSVYLGLDTRTNQEVVIKSSDRALALAKRLPDGRSSPEDIKEEIRLHTKISNDPQPCPYIIKLLDVVWKKDTIDLVLEYVSCGDLYTYTENKTRKLNEELEDLRGSPEYNELLKKHWKEVLKLIKQILHATAYLHARKISHRDLSLENILIDSDGNIRVIDFGNAREYADTNWLSERGRIGKEGYLSPECFANEFYDGRDNDMWCNGVILSQMLLGTPLWGNPEDDDPRFKKVYFGGLEGLKKLLTVWNLNDRLPPYCSDFLVKIFCPQKCRLTVKEALAHPYITNALPTDNFVLRNVPVQVSVDQDWHLKRRAHLTRYQRVEIPKSWLKLNQEQRQKVINQLIQLNKNRTILHHSVLLNLTRNLHLEDARGIIHYLWASSQYPSQVEFLDHKRTDVNLDVDKRKHTVERRGYDVDIGEDQKCDLRIHENLNVQPSLPVAHRDDTISKLSRRRLTARPSETPVVVRKRCVPSNGYREKRVRSPEDVSERRTQSRMGGFALTPKKVSKSVRIQERKVSKSVRIQEKSFSMRQRRRGRLSSAGNKSNFNMPEHFFEGDEARGSRRSFDTSRAMRSHRDDYCEKVPARGKKKYRSAKANKPPSRDYIFTTTAKAKV